MQIIDPHIHLWDLATGLYPGLETPSDSFIGNNTPIARSYLPEEYLAEGADEFEIIGAVHIEAFPTDPLAEVAHISNMAEGLAIPLAIVGKADLRQPDAEALLDAMMEYAPFRGIRQVLNHHSNPGLTYTQSDLLADPDWQRGFALLAPRRLSFDLQLYPHQAGVAARLAANHPETQIVLNHAAMWADRDLSGWRQWKAALRDLAAVPNVSCKISGLGMFDHDWTVESLRPLALEAIGAFGTERCMLASNFPVDKLFGRFAPLWRAFDEITRNFTAEERAGMFHDNARRIYRL